MATRAKYKGNGGEFLEGIPARDLDEDEYQALDADRRKMVRESKLYDTKTDAQMSGAGSRSTSASGDTGGGD
jgi:hypothetical protein